MNKKYNSILDHPEFIEIVADKCKKDIEEYLNPNSNYNKKWDHFKKVILPQIMIQNDQ